MKSLFALLLIFNVAAHDDWPYCEMPWWKTATRYDFDRPIGSVNKICSSGERFIIHVALMTKELPADAFSAFLTTNAQRLGLEVKAIGGYTSLHYASMHQPHPIFVNLLIAAGADLNAKDGGGNNALHLAAAFNSPEVVQALLDAGIKNEKNDYGNTALHYAVTLNDDSEVVEIVYILLNAGVNKNTRNAEGDTVLHNAAWHSTPEVVEILLNAGVNKNAKNQYGKTALDIAKILGRDEIARVLRRSRLPWN